MVIGLCYFFILRKSNFRYACILAIVGIVALLPHVIYLLSINSGLTESALGYDILAYEREPHHADSNSFNLKDIINSLIIVFGIIFCRSKSLRTILVVGSLFLFSSFILSEIISSSILSLMYPWRISIVLVPISFCIVLVTLFEFVTSKSIYIQKILGQKKYVNIIFFGLFLIFFLGGIKINENYWHIKNDNGLTKFLKEKKMYETPILIPIKMEHIRLNAQVPIFIDWKSAPKTGAEIIEWKRRIDLANKFYNSQTQNEAKEVLKEIFYTSNVRFALINQNIKMILDCECEVINDEFNLVNINDCVTIK